MELTDLMVGDYISVGETHSNMDGDYDVFFKDRQITIEDFKFWAENDWDKNDFDEFLAPIPLTPEILEKNGFILIEKEKGAYGVDIVPYYTRDDVPFEVFCDGRPFAIWFKDPVNIEYVHQLQHALRLCGIIREIII